jgi:hypothetical protein
MNNSRICFIWERNCCSFPRNINAVLVCLTEHNAHFSVVKCSAERVTRKTRYEHFLFFRTLTVQTTHRRQIKHDKDWKDRCRKRHVSLFLFIGARKLLFAKQREEMTCSNTSDHEPQETSSNLKYFWSRTSNCSSLIYLCLFRIFYLCLTPNYFPRFFSLSIWFSHLNLAIAP